MTDSNERLPVDDAAADAGRDELDAMQAETHADSGTTPGGPDAALDEVNDPASSGGDGGGDAIDAAI